MSKWLLDDFKTLNFILKMTLAARIVFVKVFVKYN